MTKQAAKAERLIEYLQKQAEDDPAIVDIISEMSEEEAEEFAANLASELEREGVFADIDAIDGNEVEPVDEEEGVSIEAALALASTEEGLGKYAAHAAIDQYVTCLEQEMTGGSSVYSLLKAAAEGEAASESGGRLARAKAWWNALPKKWKAALIAGGVAGAGGAGYGGYRLFRKKK